jgi:hypothetical protein
VAHPATATKLPATNPSQYLLKDKLPSFILLYLLKWIAVPEREHLDKVSPLE